MTPVRLKECLAALRWSALGLSKALNRSEGSVRQWMAGKVRIPNEVGAWLEKLARYHECNPPPARDSKRND